MTYDELKTAVQDYLESSEATFLANFDMFVEMVENRVYTDPSAQLPSLRKNITGTCEVGNKYLALPDDFLSVFSLAVYDISLGDYQYCMLKDVNLIHEAYPNPAYRNTPKYYGMFDHNTLIFGPTPDKAYAVELHYQYNPPSLTTIEETWLSKHFPSVLLYGVIAEGYRFLKGNAAQQKVYDEQYEQALGTLKVHSTARRRTDAYANNLAKPTTPVGE